MLGSLKVSGKMRGPNMETPVWGYEFAAETGSSDSYNQTSRSRVTTAVLYRELYGKTFCLMESITEQKHHSRDTAVIFYREV